MKNKKLVYKVVIMAFLAVIFIAVCVIMFSGGTNKEGLAKYDGIDVSNRLVESTINTFTKEKVDGVISSNTFVTSLKGGADFTNNKNDKLTLLENNKYHIEKNYEYIANYTIDTNLGNSTKGENTNKKEIVSDEKEIVSDVEVESEEKVDKKENIITDVSERADCGISIFYDTVTADTKELPTSFKMEFVSPNKDFSQELVEENVYKIFKDLMGNKISKELKNAKNNTEISVTSEDNKSTVTFNKSILENGDYTTYYCFSVYITNESIVNSGIELNKYKSESNIISNSKLFGENKVEDAGFTSSFNDKIFGSERETVINKYETDNKNKASVELLTTVTEETIKDGVKLDNGETIEIADESITTSISVEDNNLGGYNIELESSTTALGDKNSAFNYGLEQANLLLGLNIPVESDENESIHSVLTADGLVGNAKSKSDDTDANDKSFERFSTKDNGIKSSIIDGDVTVDIQLKEMGTDEYIAIINAYIEGNESIEMTAEQKKLANTAIRELIKSGRISNMD